MSLPEATFSTLPHADGSATYSWQGYTIHCAVNGPIERQRRDELPEEAYLEVNLRPPSRSGGDPHLTQPIQSKYTDPEYRHSRAHPRNHPPPHPSLPHPHTSAPTHSHPTNTSNHLDARVCVHRRSGPSISFLSTSIAAFAAYRASCAPQCKYPTREDMHGRLDCGPGCGRPHDE